MKKLLFSAALLIIGLLIMLLKAFVITEILDLFNVPILQHLHISIIYGILLTVRVAIEKATKKELSEEITFLGKLKELKEDERLVIELVPHLCMCVWLGMYWGMAWLAHALFF